MDLQEYCKILALLLISFTCTFGQTETVKCVDPKFDALVDDYLDYSIPTITVADAYEAKEKYVFLDARELHEYKTSHIEKAIHIGYDDFDMSKLESIPKDANIVIYCSIGYRSEKIGEKLKKKGYQSVQNLYGSIFEWVNQHYPIYDYSGYPTVRLHTYSKKWSKWINDEDIIKVW